MPSLCVLGLGYIGLPTASIFATKGRRVLGVDVSPSVVETINSGRIHIQEPDLDVLVVAPICPHTLSDRPIVVAARSVIEVRLTDRPDSNAEVVCDGRPLGRLAPGDRLTITAAPQRITLLHPAGYDYYRLLRSKLNWGRRAFDPPT